YTVTSGCGTIAVATDVVTVNPLANAGTITGVASVCTGAATTLSDAVTGGIWSSTNTGVATVIGGVVTGASSGTATISYTVANGCSTAAATAVVTVNPAPNAGTITGVPSVCVSATTMLSDVTTGGTWSSSNTGIATVIGGLVGGVSSGTA